MARQKFDTRNNLPSYRGYVILSFVFILYNDIKREEILNYPNEHIYQMEMFQLTLEFQAFCGRRAHHYPKYVSLLIVSRNLNLIWTEAAVTTEKIEATEKMRIFIEKEYTRLSKNSYIT